MRRIGCSEEETASAAGRRVRNGLGAAVRTNLSFRISVKNPDTIHKQSVEDRFGSSTDVQLGMSPVSDPGGGEGQQTANSGRSHPPARRQHWLI